MSEVNIAEELAALKQQAAEAQKRAQESDARAVEAQEKAAEAQSYMEGIRKAAMGEQPEKPKNPADLFVDDLLKAGDQPVRQVVYEEMQKRAYLDSLSNKFKDENPHLMPMKEEVFGMANQIVNMGLQKGQPVTYEDALKQARDVYDQKHKSILKISGANASMGGYSGMPQSRYAGCEEDYFAMSDKDFKKVMDKKDGELKKRQRERLAYYGEGR
jgi:hypothetical protein